jgi:hypothetical protein
MAKAQAARSPVKRGYGMNRHAAPVLKHGANTLRGNARERAFEVIVLHAK